MTKNKGRKIALIGHSGSGKSACLIELSKTHTDIDSVIAEMDRSLGTNDSPSMAKAFQWITENKSPVVAVGVHFELFKAIANFKNNGNTIDNICFVYLRKIKSDLASHLKLPNEYGELRQDDNVNGTIAKYGELDGIFMRVQDHTIDIAVKDVSSVAQDIERMLRDDLGSDQAKSLEKSETVL